MAADEVCLAATECLPLVRPPLWGGSSAARRLRLWVRD